MRDLYILRGIPASGKSTITKKLGLELNTISTDDIRLLLNSPIFNEKGGTEIPQFNNKQVFSLLSNILNSRMAKGETVVVDATHTKTKDLIPYENLAKTHLYNLHCVDFSFVSKDTCRSRNNNRKDPNKVPEHVIERMYNQLQKSDIPKTFNIITGKDENELKKNWERILTPQIENFDHFNKVWIIGDLQGSFTDLIKNGINVNMFNKDGSPKQNEAYVFLGDLCDRGVENHLPIKWLNKHQDDNIHLLYGNHELHLHRWSTNRTPFSREFNNNTLPQLLKEGVNEKMVHNICKNSKDLLLFERFQKKFILTHTGLPFMPSLKELSLMSSEQLYKGIGDYSLDVDNLFSTSITTPEWIQIHGHRNLSHLPTHASPNSYNLEDQVEFGGKFRVLEVDQGIITHEFTNTHYKSLTNHTRKMRGIPPIKPKDPVSREFGFPDNSQLTEDDLNKLRNHSLIRERVSDYNPNISSFNFTRKAFLDGKWDSTNIKARGLFVNTNTKQIVARSYDKFFNVNEKPETQADKLKNSFKYPVNGFVKENGFLGLLGYDNQSESPLFCSKSTLDGPFAKLFEDIYTNNTNPEQRLKINEFLKNSNSSLIFEVVDPHNDPHIINYDNPTIILLDVVKKQMDFEKLNYKDLKKVSNQLGLNCKSMGVSLRNKEMFENWFNSTQVDGYQHKGEDIEGYVLEDSEGFQTKIKLPYYSYWKKLRGVKDRVLTIRGTNKPLQRQIHTDEEKSFVNWCKKQTEETLKKPITEVRELFLNHKEQLKKQKFR